MNRAFKGVWIPAEIWLSEELSLQEKVLLTEIDSLDNDEGCFATNKHFAKFMNLSERQVRRVIQNLIDKDFISSNIIYKKESKEVDKRILKICRPPYPDKEGMDENVLAPMDRNDQGRGQKCPRPYGRKCPR